jgi:hypothetical protein
MNPCPFCWNQHPQVAIVDCFLSRSTTIPKMVDKWQVICPGCGARGPDALNQEEAEIRWGFRGSIDYVRRES